MDGVGQCAGDALESAKFGGHVLEVFDPLLDGVGLAVEGVRPEAALVLAEG